jgi:molybdate transport system regulatory protein
MDMSYRRAWLLVDGLNRLFKKPLVTSRPGGKAGGGASLTPFGQTLVRRYRAMESDAHTRFAADLAVFQRALVGPSPSGAESRSARRAAYLEKRAPRVSGSRARR